MDNPFAVDRRPRAPLRTVRTLAVVVVALVGVLAIQWGSQRWLLARLSTGLNEQPIDVRIQRLQQIAQLGSIGMPVLTEQLASPEEAVARTAFDLLREDQRGWVELTDRRADDLHHRLVQELTEVAPRLPRSRSGWLAMLLNRTIVETVEHASSDASLAYRQATELLASFSAGDGVDDLPDTSERLASSDPDAATPRVALRTQPLPLEDTAAATSPPPPAAAQGPETESSAGQERSSASESQEALLQPLETSNQVPQLSPVRVQSGRGREAVVVPVEYLSGGPFEAYTTRSVIAGLRSVQPQLRDAAHRELQRRGFDQTALLLAERLADPDIRVRLALLSELARHDELDPRQWLQWLGEDAEPEVRRQAIAALGTMDQAETVQWLRERLAVERDPAVADLIRRILQQRKK